MGKLKTFFRTLTKSIIAPAYYKDVIKAKFSFSLKYFLFFILLLAIAGTVALGIPISKQLPPLINRATAYAQTFYPDDLVFTVKSGKLTINRPSPFTVPLPLELLSDKPAAIPDSERINLFVYDAKAAVADFESYKTLILANEELVMTKGNDAQGIRVFPIKDAQDTTIDKSMVDKLVNSIVPYTKYIVPLFIVLIFFGLLWFTIMSKLVSLIFLTMLVMPIGNIVIKLNLPYKKYYQIGLHSATLPTLVQAGLFLFDVTIPIPYFLAIFFLLYTCIILSQLKTAE